VPDHFHIVFNRPPTGVSDDEFNAWALHHYSEVLAVPGWLGARRYRLDAGVVPETPIPFPFMSLYELDAADPLGAVEAEKINTTTDRVKFRDWMDRAREEQCFAGWTALPLSERVGTSGSDTPLQARTLYMVFNRPPTGVSDKEFNEWAIPHFDEILVAPGWASAQRFKLEPSVLPENSPIPFSFMSLYELEGDPAAAVAAMQEESRSGNMDFPDWFARAQEEKCFASWTCVPLSERHDPAK
jgi:hypothetical protein